MTMAPNQSYPDRVTLLSALSGTPNPGVGVSAEAFHLVMCREAGCLIV
jgi:hypothetical protein